MALPNLLSRYLAHFGEPLPPVLTGDAAEWVKEDFMRQALRRVEASIAETPEGSVGAQHGTFPVPCRGVACYARNSRQRRALRRDGASVGAQHSHKNLLTDERLDTAPEGIRDARRRLRGLIPEASRLHLELVVASRPSEGVITKEKEKALKARRARLVEKLCEVLDERDSLWKVIEDYLGKADE